MNHASILNARRALSRALQKDTIDVDEVDRAIELLDQELARKDLYADSGTDYLDIKLDGKLIVKTDHDPDNDVVKVAVREPGGNAQRELDKFRIDVEGVIDTEVVDLTNAE